MIAPMVSKPNVQSVAKTDLDDLLVDLKRRGTTELVLLGSRVEIDYCVKEWPSISAVSQLEEFVPRLAQRVAVLKQLTFLDLSDNAMKGVASLAALA